ncbi:MAG: winged helix DNA-binding protein [Anaerolactibacter massiliensis]|jgi:DNA-binding MarR family transcriptional regulator|nr:winged helix DNA-binding protein [Anaerolactibacter massiliensis]
MNPEKARMMFDSLYLGKRIWELQPELPEGMTAGSIHILDQLDQLSSRQETVCVSDISTAMNLPRPGITKAVKELAEAGYIEKHQAEKDGRVVHISLSEKGKETVRKYVKDYFRIVSEKLSDLSDEDIVQMNETVTRIYDHLVTGKEGEAHE